MKSNVQPIRVLPAARPETAKKYHSKSALKNRVIQIYFRSLLELVEQVVSPGKDVFEIGCGEGQVAAVLMDAGFHVRGCDLDEDDVSHTKAEIRKMFGINVDDRFYTESVYNLDETTARADLVLCCEVLEHLERPEEALEKIARLANPYFIVTVPREPLWRIVQMCSLNNLKTLGNTPGHINHWSKRDFLSLVGRYGEILRVRTPLPFTMLLCKKASR